jgi:predicted nucleic acid-binding protein
MMSRHTYYLETSVVSYLSSRPSRDQLSAARQSVTHDWWERTNKELIFISDLVLQEISRGNEEAAGRRLALVADLAKVSVHEGVNDLAKRLMDNGLVPNTEPEDAAHIANATLQGFEFLVTWNFAHFVGPQAKFKVFKALSDWGFTPALFATPEELLEESA